MFAARRLLASVLPLMIFAPVASATVPILPGCSSPETFASTPGLAIADQATAEDSIFVFMSQPVTSIWDVDVTTNITHTFNADIEMTLTSPQGTVVTLTTDNGAGNDNVFAGTLWDDQAGPVNPPGAVTDVLYTNLVTETPVVPEEPFGAFIGENPNGTWTLRIFDDAGGDIGTLVDWSISIAGCGSAPVTAEVSATQTSAETITNAASFESTLTIAGAGPVLCDVDLQTFITHTFAADLEIFLTSPAGTQTTISTDNGSGNDNVFNGTIWDDDAGDTNPPGAVSDTVFANLVSEESVTPEGAMAAFNGENPNGVWTLTIFDDAAGDQGTLNEWALTVTTCSTETDVAVTKTASEFSTTAGNPMTYTLSVINRGPSGATDVVVTDTLPAEVTYLSDTCGSGPPVSGELTWMVGELMVNEVATCEVTVQVDSFDMIVNTAVVTAYQLEIDPSNNFAAIVTNTSDLLVSKRVSRSDAASGETFSYLLEVLNQGPGDETGVVVTDTLPSSVTYVADSCGAGPPAGDTLTWNVGDVLAGEIVSCVVSVEITGSGPVVNLVEVTGTFVDTDAGNNADVTPLWPLQIGPSDIRLSHVGLPGSTESRAQSVAVAHNSVDDERLVVWSGNDHTGGLATREFEIFGRLVDGEGNEIGGDFRISDMGPDGSEAFGAFTPTVAHNPNLNQYLVIWSGSTLTGALVTNELEIFGQRIDAGGNPVASNFRISDMGPDGDTAFGAFTPTIVHSSTQDQFLVVWSGNDNTGSLASGEFEIFGQLLQGNAAPSGGDFQISSVGPDGDTAFGAFTPAVAHLASPDEYLVVWRGDEDTGGAVSGEYEIYGQRLDSSASLDGNAFRISQMGPDGDTDFAASDPKVASSATESQFLVVWSGNDTSASLATDELEIYGQRLDADGDPVGNRIRVSQMGIDGESLLGASRPAVVHNAADREFLVVWEGGGSPVADQTGSIVNSPGTGANGADESVLQSVSLGMNTLGLSLFIPSFRLADDFTVTDPDGLALEEIVLFAYQTGSTLDSTITEFNLRIWDRPPDVPGAKVLFGDDVTNRLTKTSWTGIYRVTETIPGNTLRPIMMNTVAAGVFLEPGTYWFDCQADGTLGSGPFMAPITINGVAETGNAMQYSAATMSWGPARDSTFGQPQQGFPFVLRGRRSHETEILGQRLFDSTGQEIGPDDFRISSMGPDHSLAYSPFAPAIAVRDAVNEYLVVWTGDDTRGSLVDGEFEAFGQRLRGHGETGSTGFTSLNIVYHILGLIPFQTGMDTNMDGDVDASDVVTNENAINP